MTPSIPPEPKRIEADRNMPNSIARMAAYLAGSLVAHQYIHALELQEQGFDSLWEHLTQSLYEALVLVDPAELQAIYERKMREAEQKFQAAYEAKQAEDKRVWDARKAAWDKPEDKAE